MGRAAKKVEYKVTVTREEKTPEEAERVRKQITAVLYEKKLLSIQRHKELAEKEAAEREAAERSATISE